MKPIDFIKEHNHLAPTDLSDILETLHDNKMLNKKGDEFNQEFWKQFISEEEWRIKLIEQIGGNQ